MEHVLFIRFQLEYSERINLKKVRLSFLLKIISIAITLSVVRCTID